MKVHWAAAGGARVKPCGEGKGRWRGSVVEGVSACSVGMLWAKGERVSRGSRGVARVAATS